MKKMNHVEYKKNIELKSNAELRLIIQDAREAMNAMPDGENTNYYADEVCYASEELFKRSIK